MFKKDKDPLNKSRDTDKKKWSKGKVQDKKATYAELCKEVCSSKLIALAVVSERLKLQSYLARAVIQELLSKGPTKLLSKLRTQVICTRNTKGRDALAGGEDA